MAISNKVAIRSNGSLYYCVDDVKNLIAQYRFGDDATGDEVFELSAGTGTSQCDQIYTSEFTINAATELSFDLKGGGGETDVLNNAMSLAEVRWIWIYLSTAPLSTVAIRVGPGANGGAKTNGFVGPFKDGNSWIAVSNRLDFNAPGDGSWIVDATHKIFTMYNNGGSAVSGRIVIAGTKT